MQVTNNYPLRDLNTFRITANAKSFARFTSDVQLQQLIANNNNQSLFILGGGSNILFTGDVDRLVLRNEVPGISLTKEDEHHAYIRVGAGVNWHEFVMYCVNNNLGGVENLSLIPGNVGASPMQNIGAYGVEIKDVFHQLEAFDLEEKRIAIFDVEQCGFGYRESVFKTQYKDRFVILHVTYRLNKQHQLNTTYGAITHELDLMGVHKPTISSVSQAVINIRKSKLPDPAVIGNAGSFFKNPLVSHEQFDALKKEFPALISFPADNGQTKLAAGWLIESCGWKGFRDGDAGCHSKQALVLVNHGNATGSEILRLSEKIMQSVYSRYGVMLEREVNIV